MSVQILLRIDKKENIENIYENKEIMFSCAANWIDYAIKQSDYKIGDLTEGVFARVKYPLTSTIRDKKNKPIGNNLLISCIEGTNDCFLRYIPVITTPVLCFFSLDIKKEFTKYEVNKNEYIELFLEKVVNCFYNMNDNSSEYSILVIKNIEKFYDDLDKNLRQATKSLSCEGYVGGKVDKIFLGQQVNYNKYDFLQYFKDNTFDARSLFYKNKDYEYQNEYRIVLNGFHFSQRYELNGEYDYKKNLLKVKLPNLCKYAEILYLSKYKSIQFSHYNEDNFYMKYILRENNL